MRCVPGNRNLALVLLVVWCGLVTGCTHMAPKEASGAPPPAVVEHDGEAGVVRVDHPDQFLLDGHRPRGVARIERDGDGQPGYRVPFGGVPFVRPGRRGTRSPRRPGPKGQVPQDSEP